MSEIKTKEEIELLRKAAKVGSEVFKYIIPEIKRGITESEIAAKMEEFASKAEGYDDLSFPPIIASGPNSALPHAPLSEREIQEGDFLTIDFGVVINGYCSDMTRTFLIGEPSAKQREIYNIVKESQQKGLEAVRDGALSKDIDFASRSIIDNAGYGEYFIHTTGHGIGTEVHESPRVAKDNETIMKTDMAVTIEPGIYIEEFGGVRIEDTVIITNTGCEIITGGVSKDLIVLNI